MSKQLFSYIDYDKISDDLYFLGGGAKLVLRMNVSLARRSKEGNRQHFYSEYQYDIDKYLDKGSVISMRRRFDYYMSLESLEDKDFLTGIMIRPQDMILLRSRLADVLPWFSSDIYIVRAGKLMIVNRPSTITIDGFPGGKSISFDPIVIDWEDNNQSMGVRITLSGGIYSDVTIDRFYGFIYTINSMNMIQSAQAMLAYMGMPEYGTNRYEVDTGYSEPQKEIVEKNPIIKERQIRNANKGKSYFDM